LEVLPYTVIQHGPDDFVGVGCDGSTTIKLSRSDLLVYRLDRPCLHSNIAAALGFKRTADFDNRVRLTTRIAIYEPYTGFRFPVYLTLPLEPEDLHQAVQGIFSQCDEPFILLAPTARYFRAPCESIFKSRKSCFLALDDAITVDSSNEWTATPVAHQTLQSFRELVIPQAVTQEQIPFFPTPADVTWADVRIKFRDGETVSIKVGDVTGTYNYCQMGMADRRNSRPTAQWELLRGFASGHGILTWKSPAASRKNLKRRERLAQNLKKFFRIPGEPICLTEDGKGWRTVFQLEPDN
jgi:hypothetical protein